ncbi:hypothetical protein [Cryobacterium algoritolerans]|uniref:hypothetical protein n=1 Tax=Cryobacterium algoritolerans TaxID=1259184 RepID=UPI00141BE41E|nr:hypothetical protein [Cryobacterium algoritolerans]
MTEDNLNPAGGERGSAAEPAGFYPGEATHPGAAAYPVGSGDPDDAQTFDRQTHPRRSN